MSKQEKIQQLRASIARDLALDTAARRQRQSVSAQMHAEPRRVLAASRLDMGNLKDRFERSEPLHVKIQPRPINSAGPSPLRACAAGAADYDGSAAGSSGPTPTSPGLEDRTAELVASDPDVPEAVPMKETETAVTAAGHAECHRATVKAARPAIQNASRQPFRSQISTAQSLMVADTDNSIPKGGKATKAPSRQSTRKGTTRAETMSSGTKQAWEVATAPEQPGCMTESDYSFTCVLVKRCTSMRQSPRPAKNGLSGGHGHAGLVNWILA